MSPRIAVLGQPLVMGISTNQLLAGYKAPPGKSNSGQAHEANGCRWTFFANPLDESVRPELNGCHCWIVVMPETKKIPKLADAGLVEDLRLLRHYRGLEAMVASLPVFLLFPLDSETPVDMGRETALDWVKQIKGVSAPGFGALHLQAEVIGVGNTEALPECKQIRERIYREAKNYKWRTYWTDTKGMLLVFFMGMLLLSLILGAFVLATDKNASWRGEYSRLQIGMDPLKPGIFQSTSLEPLENRLDETIEFLASYQDLPSVERAKLLESRNLLERFILAIKEAGDWPTLSDIRDISSLQLVGTGLRKWQVPEIDPNLAPLLLEAMEKRDMILCDLERAKVAFPNFEIQLQEAESLLNPRLEGVDSVNLWLQKSKNYKDKSAPLDKRDMLLSLEDFSLQFQAIEARKKWVSLAVNLAEELGYSGESSGQGQGTFFETGVGGVIPLRAKELFLKESGLFGLNPATTFEKFGDILRKKLLVKVRACRNAWLLAGRAQVNKELGSGVLSRNMVREWLRNNSNAHNWSYYGKWVAWLGNLEAKPNGSISKNNPIDELLEFLSADEFTLKPSRVEIIVPKSFVTSTDVISVEIRSGRVGSENCLVFESDSFEPLNDGFKISCPAGNLQSMPWSWEEPLVLVLASKQTGKILAKWQVISPFHCNFFSGNGELKATWLPEGSMPVLPAILEPR